MFKKVDLQALKDDCGHGWFVGGFVIGIFGFAILEEGTAFAFVGNHFGRTGKVYYDANDSNKDRKEE